jgi:hypothetical protein
MTRGFWSLLAGAASVALTVGHVYAGTPITLVTDKSTMIMVSAEPATVVIGNPSIADVSLNGKQIFLHGHAFGDTNVLIYDSVGNKLADFDISVGLENEKMASVFVGGTEPGRISYTCAPYCERSIQPGDKYGLTKQMLDVSTDKNHFATGKDSAEAAAPAAPQ